MRIGPTTASRHNRGCGELLLLLLFAWPGLLAVAVWLEWRRARILGRTR